MNQQILTKLVIESSDKDGWLDREKFAELIIRECTDLLEVEYGESTLGGNEVGRVLKQHFGVK